ncbi:MAG: hypothetical protein HDR83_00815 [Bacteroides sp.]|nr:hypothetical protein [Bacteroides sp.]
MKYHIILTLSAILMAVNVSCADHAARFETNISEAEQALADGQLTEAQSLTDALDADIDAGTLSAVQLGRLSLVHMKLNEAYTHDDFDNVGKAVACYHAAFEADADSARAFYADCAVADIPYCMTLTTIVKNIDDPMPWPEEEPDSIPM